MERPIFQPVGTPALELDTPALVLDLEVMARLRDAINTTGRLSPGKMLPTAGACGYEQSSPGRRAAM